MNTQLSHQEITTFLQIYLDGILKVGLMKPLIQMSEGNDSIAKAARPFFFSILKGSSVEDSLSKLIPFLPVEVIQLIKLGFERSALDLVLSDLIKVYVRSNPEIEEFNQLSKKYSSLNIEAICNECVDDEIHKILSRAETEKATQVFLEQEGDHFLNQKYISIKLVHIKEHAIASIYDSIKSSLQERFLQQKSFNLAQRNWLVKSSTGSDFILDSGEKLLKITFLSPSKTSSQT